MVWLDAVEDGGNTLYLDAPRRLRRRVAGTEVLQLSGVLGDGSYEGEVEVRCSAGGCEVTFADQWLAPRALAAFFARIPREIVETALIDHCRRWRRRSDGDRPRPHRESRSPSLLAGSCDGADR